MGSFTDIVAAGVFLAAAALLAHRARHERPRLAAFAAAIGACGFGAWSAQEGAGVFGVIMIIAAAFLLLHLAGEPYESN